MQQKNGAVSVCEMLSRWRGEANWMLDPDNPLGNLAYRTQLIARAVETTTRNASPAVVIVPTRSGATARSIARFRLPVWITAVSSLASTCRNLQFSCRVQPVHVPEHAGDWTIANSRRLGFVGHSYSSESIDRFRSPTNARIW
jgi:pyruvate kinase